MSTDVVSGDWETIDPWWSAYLQTRPAILLCGSASELDRDRLSSSWHELDPWWQANTESSSVARNSSLARNQRTEELADTWTELDPWWDAYAKQGHETAVEIGALLHEANAEWKQSDGPFDTDPLAADLTLDRHSRGPFRPTNEVGWSRWLAQLLTPSPALTSELFDVDVTQPLRDVVREDRLSTGEDDGSYRRPDILVFHTDRGVSIEVKLADENYRKTAKTAGLVEDHYCDYDWIHTLLLPGRKNQRLESIVEAPVNLNDDGERQIEWDDPGPVAIINWRDVTTALRSLLRRDETVDDHWAANAYLFCAAAEQQIMGFQPEPTIDRMAQPADVVETIQPIMLAGILEEQLTYLRESRGHE